jgi:hypothetical protein
MNGATGTTRGRGAVSIAAFVVTLAMHAALISSQGLTDDDDFYAPAGLRYAAWLGELVTDPPRALERGTVDRAFEINHEHPPGAKVVFGIAHALLGSVMCSLDAVRMGTAWFAAVLSMVLVLLLWRALGPIAAVSAPLLLLSLPRFVFHSEVATLDVPVACAVVVVTAMYFAADRATAMGKPRAHVRRLEIACGVVFGLGLLVKLNAPFALLGCAAWALLSRWRAFGIETRGTAALRIPPIPPALWWMLLLGPVMFVALWPWLWHDIVERLGAYFAFHLHHYPILFFYDGEIWEKPFAPWHAVPILGFGVMPITVVALGALGGVRACRALVRLIRHADPCGNAYDVDDADRLRALLLVQAVFSMAVVMNPAVPRYGGDKLFMPFFPLWCALAADGVALVVASALTLLRVRADNSAGPARSSRARALVACTVVALACAPGVLGTVKHHGGYALSYFGESVGGLRGAVARGLERTYYDVADKPLARLLDAEARRARTSVAFVPNHKEYARTYRWLQRDGYVSKTLVLEDDWQKADLVVLTHERRWSTYPSLLSALERARVIAEKRIDGVPLWSVYRVR